jgi:rfaE bifunctional protein kinase chain/domain
MKFSKLRILVLGDICLDIASEGNSYRLSPEAPVPVILNPIEKYSLGMAANVIQNLKNLKVKTSYCLFTGNDEYGEIITNLIDGHNEPIADDNYKTTVKKRILANGQQVARLDYEYKLNEDVVIEEIEKELKEKINDKSIRYDAIIISDYNKGYITEKTWAVIRPLIVQLSDSIFVDTKKVNVLDFYKGMYLFPNKKEMSDILNHYNYTTEYLLKQLNSDFIVETLSEEGAKIHFKNDTFIKYKALASQVSDVSGAGDTFIATFALAYARGNGYVASLKFANYCCSKVVQKKGTTPIILSEVEDFDFKSIR